MSANNMYYAKKIGGTWYGWQTTAEQVVDDSNGVRKLLLCRAEEAKTLPALREQLDAIYEYAEYGLSTEPYLAKDGTPIEVLFFLPSSDGIYPRCVYCLGENYTPAVLEYSKGKIPCAAVNGCGKFLPKEYIKLEPKS